MRQRWAIVLALVIAPVAASASRRETVEQFKQSLAADEAAHRKDGEIAQHVAEVELTARLSAETLRELLAASPGPETKRALRAVADISAFLDPQPAEIPVRMAPDVVAQKAILNQTVHYVARTLPMLPNFLATRKTDHYSDSPGAGFTFRVHAESPILFRDGRESDDPSLGVTATEKKAILAKGAKEPVQPNLGLSSWGEFGPILGIVLVDAAKGKLSWAHWEEMEGKPVAVFQFAVDRAISHYTVQYWSESDGGKANSATGSRGGGFMTKGIDKPSVTEQRKQAVGYHGLLTVDPETGTILRISIVADLRPDDPIQKAEILVEYGPVRIGSGVTGADATNLNTRICPTHSISISSSHARFQRDPVSPVVDIVEQQLNEVQFTNYRRFGSEVTLITSVSDSEESKAPESPGGVATVLPPATAASDGVASVKSTAVVASPAAAPEQPAPSPASVAVASTVAAKVDADADAEILVRAVNGMPGLPGLAGDSDAASQSSSSDSGNFTLKVTTRLVDIGLVAQDKHGKPVTDLTPEQIELYDNGHRQQVRAFHHGLTGAASAPAGPQDPKTFTNTVTVDLQNAPDVLLLLLDESHLAYLDLNRARSEVLGFLKAARPGTRLALYAIGEHGFHVIQDVTSDHAVVEQKLAAWVPSAAAVSQAQSLETRTRQHIDEVRNVSDLNSVNGGSNSAPDYITSIDPQLRQMGDNPLSAALGSMITLARHFASVPGHKSIAWIAGDSVLADWSDQLVGMEKGDKLLEGAIQHTKDALNEAHVALYAIDASAVGASGPDASLENQNVMLNPTATNLSAPGALAPTRNTTAGRQTAEMQQNLHAIQGPVRLLAESTGGRAINKGSDLKATLATVEQDSEALYEIGFNPDTQADGKLHTLLLKVPSRKDLKLRYRTGYVYSEESTETKERFQQAIWSPQDLPAISLRAEVAPASETAYGKTTLKLRIALQGLAVEKKQDRWLDNLYIFIAQRDDATQKAEVSGTHCASRSGRRR